MGTLCEGSGWAGRPCREMCPLRRAVSVTTWTTRSAYLVRLLTTLLLLSVIWVSRLAAAGGENSQWSRATPVALAHQATCPTRKSPDLSGRPKAAEVKATEPGGAITVPKSHGLEPLQT